jgi:hypothetical protein
MYTVHFPCTIYYTVVLYVHQKYTGSLSVAGELGNYFRQYCPNAQQPSDLAMVIVLKLSKDEQESAVSANSGELLVLLSRGRILGRN